MSRFDELDFYFDTLKQVERSEDKKQKTLENVLQSKKKEQKRKHSFAGIITILGALVAIIFLLTTLEDEEDVSATGIIIHVKEIWAAESISATSFKAYSTSPLKSIELADETFQQELERFMEQLTPLAVVPDYREPSYDLTIQQVEGSPLQVKIWEKDDEVFLYSFTEEKYYTSKHKSASNVYRMLNNIPFPK